MAIKQVPGGFIAIEDLGGDVQVKHHHTRESAEHALLWSFSRHLAELEEKISAAADLWDVYEAGDFGDGNKHRGFMRRLLRECESIALRLHYDDPAWSLLGTAADSKMHAVVIAEDGTEIKGYDDADEWLRLKSNRLRQEDMARRKKIEEAAKEAADAADPEKRKRAARFNRKFLRHFVETLPPPVVAAELKRAAKRTRRANGKKITTSKRRAQ